MRIKIFIKNIIRFCNGFLSFLKFRVQGEKAFTKMTYKDLYDLSFFSKRDFKKIKTKVISYNKKRIAKKPTCKVGFVVFSLSMWSVDGLYKLLEQDKKFSVSIIVVPISQDVNSISKETLNYFVDGGYVVNTLQDSSLNLEEFDVLVYTHPYTVHAVILDQHLDKLAAYISYSYMLADKIEKLDLPLYLLSWRFFCDSVFYKKLVENKSRVYTDNAVFCGYPKMDGFYLTNIVYNHQKQNKKVIIYAPHHSVNRQGIRSATIEQNGWFFLYLVEKYKDLVFWIVKPHPELRYSSVEAGLFKDENDYNSFLNEWVKTGTAEVVENGNYFGVFKESDAMITDSVSFLAEFQFTGKPLLLLESGKQTYNEFGNQIREILYRCDGNDFNKIESFIKNIVNGIDPMMEKRKVFFQKNLSNSNEDNHLANDNIYKMFKEELTI